MIPVRAQGLPNVVSRFGPLATDHPLFWEPCPACDNVLGFSEQGGETPPSGVVLVYIGPGSDPDDQAKARDGRWLSGVSVAVHAACAGEPT